jgi:hypothetical protein
VAAFIAFGASAQSLPQPPQLRIAAPAEKPVALEAVKISTDIRGSLAVTSVEMRFFNPNARQLEGELQFPLLDGQRVVGMSMDIDGKLRDAVPVEKARGQEVFEEVTRARIDPALIQQTQGNNYKLRVFPILPGKHKTVVVRYLESLAHKGSQHIYRLPLAYASQLAAFDLTVTVADKPSRQHGASALGTLAFERTGQFYTAHVERRQFAAQGVLEIAVPMADRPRSYTQVRDGTTYFYAEVPAAARTAPRTLPRTVTLIWDASASGAKRQLDKEFLLLDSYFRKVGNVEVKLVRLRDAVEPAQSFSIRSGDWAALAGALQETVNDGATNFAAFVPDAQSAADEYLLFSDGLGNYGGTDFAATKAPVYTVSSSPQTNAQWLAHVAQRSGGRYIDLASTDVREAAKQLLSTTTRLLSAGFDDGTQAVAPSPYPKNGVIRVAGVLAGSNGVLRLQIASPGQGRRTVAVDIGKPRDARESPFAAIIYASLQVSALEADYRLHRAEILRLGKTFGLVTRETSLIVLDRVEDYARFEIAPPAELRADYERLAAALQQRKTTVRVSQLERVVKLFQEKQAWWERDFPKGERPAPPKPAPAAAQERRPAAALTGSPPPRPDAARREAPAPAAAAARAAPPPPAPIATTAAASGAPEIGIQLRRWTPDAPYIARLEKARPEDVYGLYLAERGSYRGSTAFYLDVADQLLEKGQRDLGLRVLSNLAEMDLENRHVLRVLGYRLLQAGAPKLAIPVFQQVLELSPEEPQSYRDLGLAYAADRQYQKAIDALHEVVVRTWNERFPEIELIAVTEMNATIAEAERAGTPLDVSRIDPRLRRNLPVDTRVVLTWDADSTDIDLWVIDPNGEKADYSNRLTYQGGRMSRDFTGGYGPEEFSLRHAKPGRHVVQVQFYGHNRSTVAGATTLQVRLFSGYGTEAQRDRMITLRLRERKDSLTVGEFEVAPQESGRGK